MRTVVKTNTEAPGGHSTAVAFGLRNPAAPGSILGSGDFFGKKLRLDDSRTAEMVDSAEA